MSVTTLTSWEYLVEKVGQLEGLQEALQVLGSEGWELVQILDRSTSEDRTPAKTLRMRRECGLYLVCKRLRTPGS